MLAEVIEDGGDFIIARYVARKQQVGILPETFCEFFDAAFELVVLVRERDLRALSCECFRDPCGNRTIACDADDQRLLAGHEAH